MKIRYFKTPPNKRVHMRVMCIVAIIALCGLAVALLCFQGIQNEARAVYGRDAAARFTADDSPHPYTQLSVYFDKDRAMSLDALYRTRAELQKALEQNAITAQGEEARLYLDAYSFASTLTLSAERQSITADATVCGGNFFYLHAIPLISGNYFSEEIENIYTAILDERAAWELFGATDVSGMDITVSGQQFRITGVAKLPTDAVEKEAYGSKPHIYINYMGYRMASGNDGITAYEVLLPDPIKNFAENMLTNVMHITEEDTDAVLYDTKLRFSLEELLSAFPRVFTRAMRHETVMPPFWENVARVAEAKAIWYAGLCMIIASLSALCLAITVFLWFYIHPIKVRAIYTYFEDIIEHKRMQHTHKQEQKNERNAI